MCLEAVGVVESCALTQCSRDMFREAIELLHRGHASAAPRLGAVESCDKNSSNYFPGLDNSPVWEIKKLYFCILFYFCMS